MQILTSQRASVRQSTQVMDDDRTPAEREGHELMRRVRNGDSAAFEEVVERYWMRTLSYARHMCGDSDGAYDVTQETFGRLWEVRGSWEPTGSVKVWLLRTARNLVLLEQRRLKTRARLAIQVVLEYRPVRTPLEDAEKLEIRTAIARAIRKLSARRREAVTLFHLQGLTYREVAAIMGVRPQTAMNYVQAGIGDLRVLLARHFPSPSSRTGEDQDGAPHLDKSGTHPGKDAPGAL